jgi:hypothetical protein
MVYVLYIANFSMYVREQLDTMCGQGIGSVPSPNEPPPPASHARCEFT